MRQSGSSNDEMIRSQGPEAHRWWQFFHPSRWKLVIISTCCELYPWWVYHDLSILYMLLMVIPPELRNPKFPAGYITTCRNFNEPVSRHRRNKNYSPFLAHLACFCVVQSVFTWRTHIDVAVWLWDTLALRRHGPGSANDAASAGETRHKSMFSDPFSVKVSL